MRILVPLVLALALTAPASAATRNFGVSGFDRVRVDGDYKVNLTVGVAPFAKAVGTARAIDPVVVVVEGRTLIVRSNRSGSWGGYPGEASGPAEINIGTHELTAAYVNGAGSLNINRVEGLKFETSAQGAGAISIGQVEVDQLSVALAGAASARLAGKAGKVTAMVRGMSGLDAEALVAKDAVIGAQGPAIVRLTVTQTAKVDAAGVGSVTLTGRPACTVKVQGSASVSGCK